MRWPGRCGAVAAPQQQPLVSQCSPSLPHDLPPWRAPLQADAVLHFGTHGSLEFMPGKQVRHAVPRCAVPRCAAPCFAVAVGPLDGACFASLASRRRKPHATAPPCTSAERPPNPHPRSLLIKSGGHERRVLPRLPHWHHPQPLLLRRQQPLGCVRCGLQPVPRIVGGGSLPLEVAPPVASSATAGCSR